MLQEPTPRLPLNTGSIIPLLHQNAEALAKLDPPIRNPLSLLSHLNSVPAPPPYVLPSGDVLLPPEPSSERPRKLVIFGDCSGGTRNQRFRDLCHEPSLLVHECTNGAIPELVQRGNAGRKVRIRSLEHSLVRKQEHQNGEPLGASAVRHQDEDPPRDKEERRAREAKDREETQKKAQKRGHSTPQDVGAFARDIGARRVVVNHFSAMWVISDRVGSR